MPGTLRVFDNSAFAGTPIETVAHNLSHLSFDLPTQSSVVFTAVLSAEHGWQYLFTCIFGANVHALLHVDGHLVCSSGVASPLGVSRGIDNPLRVGQPTELPLRLALTQARNSTGADRGVGHRASFQARVLLSRRQTAPPSQSKKLDPSVVLWPTVVGAANEQREALEIDLARGWGAWAGSSYLMHVLLPEGITLNLALCNLQTQRCVTRARIDCFPNNAICEKPQHSPIVLRPGIHAYDRSYGELHATIDASRSESCNVSIAFAGGDRLRILVKEVHRARSTCPHHALVAIGGSSWYRRSIITSGSNSILFESAGGKGSPPSSDSPPFLSSR